MSRSRVKIFIQPTIDGKRKWTELTAKTKWLGVHPTIYLRWLPTGANNYRYEKTGAMDYKGAKFDCAKKELELLESPDLGLKPKTKRRTVGDATTQYLNEGFKTWKHKTYLAYNRTISDWRATCTKEFLNELVLQDLQNYRLAMVDAGLSNRTIKNRLTYVGIFLHKQGVALSLSHKYTKKKPRQYNGELHKLLEASSKDERQIWDAFRMSGLREDEMAHACYSDLEASKKSHLDVLCKPQHGNWEPKGRKERSVLIPVDLVQMLRERQKEHPGDDLIFPNGQGDVEGHFLRILKKRALVAGLNCGHCISKVNGKEISCADGPYCATWGLHKFRKTYATTLYNGGRGKTISEIGEWLGHEDEATTRAYLANTEAPKVDINDLFRASDAEHGTA